MINGTAEEYPPTTSFITSGRILLTETGNEEYNSFDNFSSGAGAASGENPKTRDEDLAKLEVTVLACMFLVILMGNFIVITGIYFRQQKMSRMYYFILHLSLADLITAFFNVAPQFAMELTWPEFLGGNVFCKFIKYMQILGPYASSYVLVVTALDRYQAIGYPMSNCNWNPRQSKLMIGFAWGIAILFCIPQVFVFSLEEVATGVYDCWATFIPSWGAKVYVTWYCLSIFIVPLGVLVFAYTCICRAIWLNASIKNTALYMETTSDICRDRCNSYGKDTTMTIINGNGNGQWNDLGVHKNCKTEEDEENLNEVKKLMSSDKNEPSKTHSRIHIFATTKRPSICPSIADSIATQPRAHSLKGISTAKIKTVKLTVTVILCYIVASTPFIVAELWSTYDPLAHTSPFYTGTTFTILTLLASLNSCVNPWIFLFFNPNLLQDFVLGCRRNCCYIG